MEANRGNMINKDNAQHLTQKSQKILVVGATGGTGLAVVQQLLRQGHKVTAFSRQSKTKFQQTDFLTPVDDDVMLKDDVERAVQGQDAVIVVLGISENPLRVRLFGPAKASADVRSKGTQNVINAMQMHGIKRLVVQSSYGVGETRGNLGIANRLFFNLVLKPQIEDTEEQERVVRASGVDWVLVQPVHLHDKELTTDDSTLPYLSISGDTRKMNVTRTAVARFLVMASCESEYIGKTVSVSG